jgi:hypothetical protein
VEAAGFVLDAESTMLANKDDPHSIKVFDPSIKGETDRFAYRFVKPVQEGAVSEVRPSRQDRDHPTA